MPSSMRKQVNGFLVCEKVVLAKESVLTYQAWEFSDEIQQALGYPATINVYRSQAVLGDDLSLYEGLPLTDGHWWEPITVKDTSRVCGMLQNAKSGKRGLSGGLVVTDANCIFDIESDEKRELSLGYKAEFKVQSGTFDGISYDLVITEIIPNHVALVKAGRCGPECAIQDGATCGCNSCSSKNSLTRESNTDMSDQAKKLIAVVLMDSIINVETAEQETLVKNFAKELADAKAEVETLKGQITAKDGEITKLTEDFSDEKIAAMVINGAQERSGLITKAAAYIGDADVTKMSNREIKVLALTNNKVEVADGATDDFVDGAFGALPVKQAGTKTASTVATQLTTGTQTVADGGPEVDPVKAARDGLIARNGRQEQNTAS